MGDIHIVVNRKKYDYTFIELSNKEKIFKVDKRFKILVRNFLIDDEEVIIECILKTKNNRILNGGSETGENLALISFAYDNVKLSIGTIGDVPGVYYEYLKDRICIRLTKDAGLKEVVFYVAWITMQDILKEEIYTWFAADPTLRFKKRRRLLRITNQMIQSTFYYDRW